MLDIQISNIDSALAKIKTKQDMYVYRQIDEKQFYSPDMTIHEQDSLENLMRVSSNGATIDRTVFQELVNKFIITKTEYHSPQFVSTALFQDPSGGLMRPPLKNVQFY